MRVATSLCVVALIANSLGGCDEPAASGVEPGEELSGGDTTVFDTTREAYARPAKNLTQQRRGDFALGDHQFNRSWVTAPASAEGSDGLGPHYHATSCSACHYKDGHDAPFQDDSLGISLFFRAQLPGRDPVTNGPLPEPTYGSQLAPFAVLGVTPEVADPTLTFVVTAGSYADGAPFELVQPSISFGSWGYGMPQSDAVFAPRISRSLIGLGLLQAIDEATIVARADPDDTDGNGISGRPNWVWDVRKQAVALGRFGWKAGQPTLEQQVALAFHGDIGITSEIFPEPPCAPAQADCLAAPNGGEPELGSSKLERITFYLHLLAVPGRRDAGTPEVLRGRDLFDQFGCSGCHVRSVETGVLAGFPELSEQTIWPYSDLLLHDMGANLADDAHEFEADGREFRTPPLWGIGLLDTVNRHTFFLHDGRARNLSEAILWHGGEAASARESFRVAGKDERASLLAFLESL